MATSIGIRGSRTTSDERAFSCICQILRIRAYSPEITPVLWTTEDRKMLPNPPPTLKGNEAKAFLKDAAEPPTDAQKTLLEEALKRFPK